MNSKILLAFLSACFTMLSSLAQNTSPYWSQAGNSGTAGKSKLGTTDSVGFSVVTSNRTHMYFNANGNIGIGTSAPNSPLEISPVRGTSTGLFVNGGGPDVGASVAISGYGKDEGISGTAEPSGSMGVYGTGGYWGVYGVSTYGVAGYGTSVGVHGFTSSGRGVYGYTTTGTGVSGQSFGSGYGGYFQSATGYGVVGRTGQSSGMFAGAFYGQTYSTGGFVSSDKRLKKNITEFKEATSLINRLKPRNYEFRTDGEFAGLNLPKGKHYGLIAQDLESIFPGMVAEVLANPEESMEAPQPDERPGPDGRLSEEVKRKIDSRSVLRNTDKRTIKAVNYTELIPILVQAMQEQDAEKEELKTKVQTLEARLQKLEAMMAAGGVGSLSSAFLDVPIPNPAKGSTLIRYSIPDNTASAKFTVVNMAGQVIKEVSLTGGSGQVNLNVSNLASGVYPCTLWVNGQQAVSKQLLIAR